MAAWSLSRYTTCLGRFVATNDMPLIFSVGEQIVYFFRRAVPRPDVGTQLFHLMQDAGLPPPECRAECVMEGGPDSLMYEWFAETLMSLSPKFENVGMRPPARTDGESLTQALREEALQLRGAFLSPMVIGAFGRKRGRNRFVSR